MTRPRWFPDNFTLLLLVAVILGSVLPCRGDVAVAFDRLLVGAIALLFFLHGAKLPREAIVAGISHWRLHLLVVACTFVMFPLLGLALRPVLLPLMTEELYDGFLFLCALPATVQSAIAFTSMARGNVPAAVCSASLSSVLGIFVTPLLTRLLLGDSGRAQVSLDALGGVVMQLLVPFIAGHLARRWIGRFVDRHKAVLSYVDRSSILLVVYTAFSASVIEGLWQRLPPSALIAVVVACGVLLALALVITTYAARGLGFDKADEITIVFCGSKKSLASGIPIARVLFGSGSLGAVVLPLMLFHQIQLMVCAVMATRYARRAG